MAEGGYDFGNPEFDRDDYDDDGDIDDKVRKRANIRNRYNQVPHLTQDTNGKVTDSQTRAKRSAFSQQVTTRHQKTDTNKLLMVPDDDTKWIALNQSSYIANLKGLLRESALEGQKQRLVKTFYDEIAS